MITPTRRYNNYKYYAPNIEATQYTKQIKEKSKETQW